jgi:hypothetical protein
MIVEMKFIIPILLFVAVGAQSCEIGRAVKKIEEHLSKSLDNHDLNYNYVLSTLMKEYATYIELESLYYQEEATAEIQECLCPYIQFAQETLEYYYTETEKCLPYDRCEKPQCNVKECCDLHLADAIQKFDSIYLNAYKCYNKYDKCGHTKHQCHDEM